MRRQPQPTCNYHMLHSRRCSKGLPTALLSATANLLAFRTVLKWVLLLFPFDSWETEKKKTISPGQMASRWLGQNSSLDSLTLTSYLRPCIEKLYLKENLFIFLESLSLLLGGSPNSLKASFKKWTERPFLFLFPTSLYMLYFTFCSFIFHCVFFPLSFGKAFLERQASTAISAWSSHEEVCRE